MEPMERDKGAREQARCGCGRRRSPARNAATRRRMIIGAAHQLHQPAADDVNGAGIATRHDEMEPPHRLGAAGRRAAPQLHKPPRRQPTNQSELCNSLHRHSSDDPLTCGATTTRGESLVSAKLNQLKLSDQCDATERRGGPRGAPTMLLAPASFAAGEPAPGPQSRAAASAGQGQATAGGAHFGQREVTLVDRTTRQLSSDLQMQAFGGGGGAVCADHLGPGCHQLVGRQHLEASYAYGYEPAADDELDLQQHHEQQQHHHLHHHHHHNHPQHHHLVQHHQPYCASAGGAGLEPFGQAANFGLADQHEPGQFAADVYLIEAAAGQQLQAQQTSEPHQQANYLAQAQLHDEHVSLVDLDAHNQSFRRARAGLPATVIQVNELHESARAACARGPFSGHSGGSSLASLSLSNSTAYSSAANVELEPRGRLAARRRNSTQCLEPSKPSRAAHQHYSASFSQQASSGRAELGHHQFQASLGDDAGLLYRPAESPPGASGRSERAPGSARRTELGPDGHDEEGAEEAEEEEEEEAELKVCEWLNCGNTFLDMQEFVRHLEERHVNQEPREKNRYFCLWSNCKRNAQEFNARYKLLIHMRVHSGEKPYPCQADNCKKSFSRLENLKIHVRSHTGEKPYKCNYSTCAKSFTNSSDRIKHHKTHQNPKPYNCSHAGCQKRYTDPSSLRKHLRAHRRQLTHPPLGVRPRGPPGAAYAPLDQPHQPHQPHQQSQPPWLGQLDNWRHAPDESMAAADEQRLCFAQPSLLPADYDPSAVLDELAADEEQQLATGGYAQPHRWRQQHAQLSRSWCAGAAPPAEPAGRAAWDDFQGPPAADWQTVGLEQPQPQQPQQPQQQQQQRQLHHHLQQQHQFRQHEQLMRSMPAGNHWA